MKTPDGPSCRAPAADLVVEDAGSRRPGCNGFNPFRTPGKPGRRLLLAGLGLAVLAVAVVARTSSPAHRIDREHALQVAVGMSEAGVEGLFGVPAGNYHPRGRVLALNKDIPAGPMKVWVGSELGVVVWFDGDGRAWHRRVASVTAARESFLGIVRRRLGL